MTDHARLRALAEETVAFYEKRGPGDNEALLASRTILSLLDEIERLRAGAIGVAADMVRLAPPDALKAKWPRELVERESVVTLALDLRKLVDRAHLDAQPAPALRSQGGPDE